MPKQRKRKFSQDRALTNTPAGNVELTGIDPNAADPSDRNVRVPVSLLPTGGGGEANTQSNEGTGVGISLPKQGINLPLRSFVSQDGSVLFGQPGDNIDLVVGPHTHLWDRVWAREADGAAVLTLGGWSRDTSPPSSTSWIRFSYTDLGGGHDPNINRDALLALNEGDILCLANASNTLGSNHYTVADPPEDNPGGSYVEVPVRDGILGAQDIAVGELAVVHVDHSAAADAFGDVVRLSPDGSTKVYNADADTDIERGNAFHQAVNDMGVDDCLLLSAGTFELSYTAEIPQGSVIGRGQSTTLKGRFSNPAGTAFPIIVNKDADTATGYDATDGWFLADFAIDSTTSGIGVAHARNVVFRNVVGRNASAGDKVGHFIDACGVEHFAVDGCSFRGSCTGAGIVQLDTCATGALVWVREGGGTASVNDDGTPSRVVTIDSLASEFTNGDGGDSRVHIELHREGITDVVINNCACKEGRSLVKLVQEASGGGGYRRIAVTGCTFESDDPQHDTDAIEITGGPTKRSSDIVVANNVVDTSGSRGIWLLDTDRAVVANNVVRMQHTAAATVLGAIVQGSANVTLQGNNFTYENGGAGSTGAVVSNSSTWVDIAGNHWSKFDLGINVGATAGTPIYVQGNTFEGASDRYPGAGDYRLPEGELSKLPENAAPGGAVMLLSENDATGELERVPVGGLPTGGGGEANDGDNVGTGAGVFRDKTGINLNFRTLVSGDASVVITENADEIDLQATGAGGGETNTQTNQGGGTELALPKNGADLPIRTLDPGQFETNVNQVRIPGGVFDPGGSAAAVQTNLDTHEARTDNPHAVTAAQAGADPAGSAAAVDARVGNGATDNLVSFDDSNNHEDSGIAKSDVTANTAHRLDVTSNPHNTGMDDLSNFSADGNEITDVAPAVGGNSAVNRTQLDSGLAGKLDEVSDDASPELGGELVTRDNDIVITDATPTEEGRVGLATGERVFIARTTNNAFDENDGAVAAGPGKVELFGAVVQIDSQKNLGEVRDVQISAEGQLIFPALPAPGWEVTDTDNGLYDVGSGTGAPSTWVRLVGLEVALPAEFQSGDQVIVAYSLYCVNTATNSNGSGVLEVGFGLNDATPGATEQTILIPFGMDSYVSGTFNVPALVANVGDTIDIFARAGSGGHPSYQLNVDGTTNEHTLQARTPSSGGGGGSGDVTGPGIHADNTIVAWNGANTNDTKDTGIDVDAVVTGPGIHGNANIVVYNGDNTNDVNDPGIPASEVDTTVFDGGLQAGDITPDRNNGRVQKFTLNAAGITLNPITNTTEGQSGRIEIIINGQTGFGYAAGWDIGGADNPLPNSSGSTVLLGWDHGSGGRLYLTGFGSEDAT